MKYLLRTCACMMMFLLIACTSDHSFKLDEKRQIIEIHAHKGSVPLCLYQKAMLWKDWKEASKGQRR